MGLFVEPCTNFSHPPSRHSRGQLGGLRKFMACNQPPKSSWAERQWRGAGRVLRVSHQPRLPNPGGIRQVVKVRDLCGVLFQLCRGYSGFRLLFTGRLWRRLAGHLCDSDDAQRAAMASGCKRCDGLKVRANQMCKFKPSEPNRTGGILLRFSGYI